jgi:anti-sigma B factor antagonist
VHEARGGEPMNLNETWHGTTVVLSFAAPTELDGRSGPSLKGMILQVLDEGASAVVVDLAAVTFVDSAGLGVLISGLKAARSRGRRFILSSPHAGVEQILDVTNLRRAFDVFSSTAEALRPPPAPAEVAGTRVAWAE